MSWYWYALLAYALLVFVVTLSGYKALRHNQDYPGFGLAYLNLFLRFWYLVPIVSILYVWVIICPRAHRVNLYDWGG